MAGAGVGSAAGFFGIGGGFVIVPGLMASTGMSLATAQATSLLSVAAFGATTAGNYALSGWVDPGLVAAMAVGGGSASGAPAGVERPAWAHPVRGPDPGGRRLCRGAGPSRALTPLFSGPSLDDSSAHDRRQTGDRRRLCDLAGAQGG
ncbi:TSUP family transporter [Brevundimonas sp. SPF441]|uniref:TSUP family transporter n=1 Tax=Brevundimonas sp. SPF441 TaxID=2663795 RepID=UPI00129EEA7C|nr:TSUP family transporter [Brevundimonas sp. SPF441]